MEKFKKFLPAIIGIILIGIGVFLYFKSNELAKNCTAEATATVVDMREDFETSADTGDFRYIYYPVVSYEVNGRVIEKELGSGSNTPDYRINDKIAILYNPNNVEEFIVANENHNLAWIITSAIGGVFLIIGIVMMFKKDI